MMKKILQLCAFVVLLIIVGNVLLTTFPELVPYWNEFKEIVLNLYNLSIVRYGTGATVIIIAALIILIGNSKGI